VSKTVTALIVDDDRAIQRLLADALTKEGFAVLVEKDGDWALKTFEKRPVDVVLLDILLPAINGYEVARKIRMLPKGKDIPIVFISGVYRAPGQRKDAVEKYKAVDFLEKPLKLQALRDAMKKALGDDYPDAAEAAAERDRIEKSSPGIYADESAKDEVKEVEKEAARANSGMPSLRGNLTEKTFPELLAEVYRWRADGALLLRRDKVKKIVYFRGGQPYFIKSNLLSECLGKIMVREKLISEAECEESLVRMKTSQRQQGTVLIEMGCISPPNLTYALSIQLQTKLFDIFTWPDGDYQFNPKAELPPETVNIELTCAAVIQEGLKRTWDLDRISAAMKPFAARFVTPAQDPLYRFQDAGLNEDEQALLDACDGHKTVKALSALGVLPPIDTLRLLLSMKFAQMIELKDEAAEGKPAKPKPGAAKGKPPAKPDAKPDAKKAPVPWPEDTSDRDSTVVDMKAYVPGQTTEPVSVPEPDPEPAPRPAGRKSTRPVPVEKPAAARPLEKTADKAAEKPSAKPVEKPAERKPVLPRPSTPPPPPPAAEKPVEKPGDRAAKAEKAAREEKRARAEKAALKPELPRASPPPRPSDGPPPLPPPLPKKAAAEPPKVVVRSAGSLLPELSGVLNLGITAEERALRERLTSQAMGLKKKDYFQVLRVSPDASTETLKQAYLTLAKEFHPDRTYRSASAEVRSLANDIYQLISTAYETLKDPEDREKYVSDLAKGIKKDVGDQVSKILAAEGKFQRGEDALRKKQLPEALAAFREAVDLYGDEGEFHAFLGWTMFQSNPRDAANTQSAMDELEAAIRLNPKVDKAYLFLGYIYKTTGRPDKAERQFEKAIQANPDCTEALKELRLLGKR
jgi:CheY-like chemotaxis protein/curved DNA-binding protein CbpA